MAAQPDPFPSPGMVDTVLLRNCGCFPPAQRDAIPHVLWDPSRGRPPVLIAFPLICIQTGLGYIMCCCYMKLRSLWCSACPRFSGFNGVILSPIVPFCFKPFKFLPLHHPADYNNALCRASCMTGSLFSWF